MQNKLIEELVKIKGLQIVCPHCEEIFPVKKAGLFDINDDYTKPVEKKIDSLTRELNDEMDYLKEIQKEILERRREIKTEPEKIEKRITASTESVNFGKIVEKIFPSVKSFPYRPADCRQLFEPIDYIVFNGLYNNGNINELTFIRRSQDGLIPRGLPRL